MLRILEQVIVQPLALALVPNQFAHVKARVTQRLTQSFKLLPHFMNARRVRVEGDHDLSQLRELFSQPPTKVLLEATDSRERGHTMPIPQQVRRGVSLERPFSKDRLPALPRPLRIAEMYGRSTRSAFFFAGARQPDVARLVVLDFGPANLKAFDPPL